MPSLLGKSADLLRTVWATNAMFNVARPLLTVTLILGSVGLGLAGCSRSDSGVITAEKSKFQVADEDGSAASSSVLETAPTADMADARSAQIDMPPVVRSQGAKPKMGSKGSAGTSPSISRKTPASSPGNDESPTEQPPAVAAEGLSGAEEGDPAAAALLAKLNELAQKEPKGATRDEKMVDFRETQNARVAIAAKLLKSNASSDARKAAAWATIESLTALEQLRTPNIRKRLRDFCVELRQDTDPEISRLARQLLFGISVGEFESGTPGAPDSAAIQADIKDLLANEEHDELSFRLVNHAADVLSQRGEKEAAKEAFLLLANTYMDHQDAPLAERAKALLEQARLVELEFTEKLTAASQGDAAGADGVLEIFRKVFDEGTPGKQTLEASVAASDILERSGQYDHAKSMLDLIDGTLAKHENPEIVKQLSARLESGRRRLSLVGKPFSVEGKLFDGKPIEWADYEGKIVLVDFWATWCGPCLREFPNIRKNYDTFHEKGFEVVGISLDENPQDLTEFFSVQKLPWPTVMHGAPGKKSEGGEEGLADRCGVTAIPFTVLVGRDGNVLAINVRGEELGKRLSEIFDPPAEPAADGDQPKQSSRRVPEDSRGLAKSESGE